jgi:exopolysaccharide biosynthesis predicted pyruvyltransferase EpsI
MTKKPSDELIAVLQTLINEVLTPIVSNAGQFALLDFPDHANVGDSAIWLGEVSYFHSVHSMRPAYVCAYESYSVTALEEALPEGPIFFHGGGNFGDLWPEHQKFREQVLVRFRDRKIVQLPQSVHFSDRGTLQQAAEIIRSHPDFTLLVRDRKSLALAKEAFECRVELCPDMAFCLGSLERPVVASQPLLLLLRTDLERVPIPADCQYTAPIGTIQCDWLDDDPDIGRRVRQLTIRELIPLLGIGAINKQKRRELLYRRLAEARLARGLRLLASSDFVITDRLHAHILCTLLAQQHMILDNSYGKLSSFVEAWTKDADCMHVESSPMTALASYSALMRHRPL